MFHAFIYDQFNRESKVFEMVDKIVDTFKDNIAQHIKDYEVSQYLASQYEEPAQIIAYEYAYEIVEAISEGQFLEQNGQSMLRKVKAEKMSEILKDKLFSQKEINFEGEEKLASSSRCSDNCAIF